MVDKAREFLCSSVSIFGRSVKKGIILLVALLLLFAIKVCNNTPDYSDVKPSYYGTFYDALKCYSYDEAKAEKLYNGKIIELYGAVNDIGEENDDGEEVYFVEDGYSRGTKYMVRVFVTDKNKREFDKFRLGAIVAFRGKCYGSYYKKAGFYAIDIHNASLVRCFPPQNPEGLPDYIMNIPENMYMSK